MSVGHQLLEQFCIVLEMVPFTIGEFEYILGTVVLICVKVITIKIALHKVNGTP